MDAPIVAAVEVEEPTVASVDLTTLKTVEENSLTVGLGVTINTRRLGASPRAISVLVS